MALGEEVHEREVPPHNFVAAVMDVGLSEGEVRFVKAAEAQVRGPGTKPRSSAWPRDARLTKDVSGEVCGAAPEVCMADADIDIEGAGGWCVVEGGLVGCSARVAVANLAVHMAEENQQPASLHAARLCTAALA
jgi:hypothetical protein